MFSNNFVDRRANEPENIIPRVIDAADRLTFQLFARPMEMLKRDEESIYRAPNVTDRSV